MLLHWLFRTRAKSLRAAVWIKQSRCGTQILTVAFSPDDAVLASGGLDRIVRLWDIASQRELMRLTGHIDSVNSVAFAPDGKTLATGSGRDDKTIKLWLGVTERDVDERRSRNSQ